MYSSCCYLPLRNGKDLSAGKEAPSTKFVRDESDAILTCLFQLLNRGLLLLRIIRRASPNPAWYAQLAFIFSRTQRKLFPEPNTRVAEILGLMEARTLFMNFLYNLCFTDNIICPAAVLRSYLSQQASQTMFKRIQKLFLCETAALVFYSALAEAQNTNAICSSTFDWVSS